MNESFAGENGWIPSKSASLYMRKHRPVRFWAVNGPHAKDPENLKHEARTLAKYGVNLVRSHGAIFDKRGEVDPEKIRHLHEVVDAIEERRDLYTCLLLLSALFNPTADYGLDQGYDGTKHPFADLYFNPDSKAAIGLD